MNKVIKMLQVLSLFIKYLVSRANFGIILTEEILIVKFCTKVFVISVDERFMNLRGCNFDCNQS